MKLTLRSAAFAPSTLDTGARTVQLIWTTGERVLRGYYDRYHEELSLDPKHVRMDRLQKGAPLLDTHDASGIESVIGVVQSAQLERARGVATVRFDTGAKGEDAMRRVSEGTLRGVSVGYRVHKLIKVEDGEDETPVYRAIDWEPHELSLTPIGADTGAHVRSSSSSSKETVMTKPKNRTAVPAEIADLVEEPTAERSIDANEQPSEIDADRERSAGIARIARAFGRGLGERDTTAMAQLGERLIREGVSLDRARARLQDEWAERGIIPTDRRDPRIESGRDSGQGRIALMAEALASRFGGPAPSEEARQYVRLSTIDFARHFLEQTGVNTRMMSPNQLVERSMGMYSTGDFPALLTETGNRMLRASYSAYTGGLQRACKQSSAPDFRPVNKLMLGEVGTLKQVNEHGEYENATGMASSKEAYSLATFGRIFGLSRQAMVNDDLGAFVDMSSKLGRAAAEFVAAKLVALLVANPTLATDATAVFHANHGNLTTGPGTAIGVASLGVAMKAMRLQKGLDGTTPIDVTPRYLVVPASLETAALQAITQITPAQTSNVNPFAGKLEPIVDPRLDAASATTWYLAADPGLIDGIEFAFLDGTGPELFIKDGWRVDGTEWKIRLDFGAGFVDFRGWYRNVGV